jgi:hypothetical protein
MTINYSKNILTERATLKKLLVSPVTTFEDPATRNGYEIKGAMLIRNKSCFTL